jgi:hypothetical protein
MVLRYKVESRCGKAAKLNAVLRQAMIRETTKG